MVYYCDIFSFLSYFVTVVYPSTCRVIIIIIILCDVWGGAPLAWYESRGTGRCFSSPIVLPEPESDPPPSPSQLAGARTYTVSGDRDLLG